MIVNCVNRKYNLSIPYLQMKQAVSQAKRQLSGYMDFTQTQTVQLLQMLEALKQDDQNTKFAYLFDSSVDQKKRLDPANPQIEVLLL